MDFLQKGDVIVYCYKVKVSMKDRNSEEQVRLRYILHNMNFVALGNDEFGTDSFENGMGFVTAICKNDWFLDNAKELVWYNGEDYDEIGQCYEEDVLTYYLKKRDENAKDFN